MYRPFGELLLQKHTQGLGIHLLYRNNLEHNYILFVFVFKTRELCLGL